MLSSFGEVCYNMYGKEAIGDDDVKEDKAIQQARSQARYSAGCLVQMFEKLLINIVSNHMVISGFAKMNIGKFKLWH